MTSPSQLQFTNTSTVHNYNARSASDECFYVKASRTDQMKTSFARIGVSIWNSFPHYVKSLSKPKFRKKIKQILLELGKMPMLQKSLI